MNMSDSIARRIFELLESQGGVVQIQRNELAQKIGCVPSQINYVLTSRFTPEHGFTVESRRGGGGYIRIERIHGTNRNLLMHVVNSVGDRLDEATARIILENLIYDNLLDAKVAKIILAAVTDVTLKHLPPNYAAPIRASIFKSMLLLADTR